MNKIYSRIDWKNYPNTSTALNETNLNRMDKAIDDLDNRVIEQDSTKANQATVNNMVKNWTMDETTGVITVEKQDGSKIMFDLNIEKIPVDFEMSPSGILTMTTSDGTQFTANIGSMIPVLTFNESDQIAVSVSGSGVNKTYSFTVKDGSITENKLQPNYLADVKSESAKAKMSETNAEKFKNESEKIYEAMKRLEHSDYSALLGYDIYNLVSLKDATYPANKTWLSIDFVAPFDGFVFFMVQTDGTSGAFTQVLREDDTLVSNNQKNIADFNTWGEAYHHQIYKGKTYHFGSYNNAATAFNKVMLCIRKKLEVPTEYVPYAPSNVALAGETTDLDKRISDNGYGEVAGGKNLIDILPTTYTETLTDISWSGVLTFPIELKSGTYTLSFLSDKSATTRLQIKTDSWNNFGNIPKESKGSKYLYSKSFVLDKDTTGQLFVQMQLSTGDTVNCSNIQIEEGSVATEYEPYFPSNKMLAEETSSNSEDVNTLKKETTVNLLNPTLQTTTQNGVTCTNNGDGTYTLKGTASVTTAFDLGSVKTINSTEYKITGCPKNGSVESYYARLQSALNVADVGNGALYKSNGTEVHYFILVDNGKTVNDLTFKPMITTNLDATYDDFVSYTGDTGKLNSDVADIKKDISSIIPSDISSITLTVTNSDVKEYVPSITFSRKVDTENDIKTVNLSLTVGAGSGSVIGIAGKLTKEELKKLQSMKIPSVFTNERYVAFFGIGKSTISYTFNLMLYAPNPQGEFTIFNNESPVAVPVNIKSLL